MEMMNILSCFNCDDKEIYYNKGLIYDNILYVFAGDRMIEKASTGEEALQLYVFSIIGKRMEIEVSNNEIVGIKQINEFSIIVGGKNSSMEFPVAGIRIVR